MAHGFLVTATGLFPNSDSVWRYRLIDVVTVAIKSFNGVPQGLPVQISLPFEPFLPSPRQSAVVIITVDQNEWMPQTGAVAQKFVAHVQKAVSAWLQSHMAPGGTTVPSGVMVDVTFTVSDWSVSPMPSAAAEPM